MPFDIFTILALLSMVPSFASDPPKNTDGGKWDAEFASSGLVGGVATLSQMPNGDIIAGGGIFTAAPTTLIHGVAKWDGHTWSELGGGTDQGVFTPAVGPSGHLFVGGSFITSGVVATHGIARWDGKTWHSLQSGMDLAINALRLMPDGSLVAGGFFSVAGPAPADGVARWDGTHTDSR